MLACIHRKIFICCLLGFSAVFVERTEAFPLDWLSCGQVSSILWQQGPIRGGGKRWKTNCILLLIPLRSSMFDSHSSFTTRAWLQWTWKLQNLFIFFSIFIIAQLWSLAVANTFDRGYSFYICENIFASRNEIHMYWL